MKASATLIGLGSGGVTAALIASVANGSVLALLLTLVIPLPLLLAGAGWGVGAASLSLITSFVLLSLLNDLTGALYFVIYMGVPAVILIYLLHLHRIFELKPSSDTEEDAPDAAAEDQTSFIVEWYPFGRIIAWAAVMSGGLASFVLFLIGIGDISQYSQLFRDTLGDNVIRRLQDEFASTLSEEEFRQQLLLLLPIGAAQVWLLLAVFNLWLATRIAAISELLPRPVPPLSMIEYPPFIAAGFFAALVVSFAPGIIGLIGSAFTGTLGLALVFLGVTVAYAFVAHSPFRIAVVAMICAGIFLYPLSILVTPALLGLGIAEPFVHLRQKRNQQTLPSSDHSERD